VLKVEDHVTSDRMKTTPNFPGYPWHGSMSLTAQGCPITIRP
jgi:hypothetical protein